MNLKSQFTKEKLKKKIYIPTLLLKQAKKKKTQIFHFYFLPLFSLEKLKNRSDLVQPTVSIALPISRFLSPIFKCTEAHQSSAVAAAPAAWAEEPEPSGFPPLTLYRRLTGPPAAHPAPAASPSAAAALAPPPITPAAAAEPAPPPPRR